MSAKILTANDLHTGRVIFLSPKGVWSTFISQACLSFDLKMENELAAIGHQAVNNQLVVEPFFIDVTIEDGLPSPLRFRERLRINGPSVRSEFSKPAYYEAA